VHLKKSLLSKMPGDKWRMHANLRSLYAYMWAHPGKKLLFMGGEIGQYREWNFEKELDWFLLEEPEHAGLSRLVRDLNRLYRQYPAMHELDDEPDGFKWIDCNDAQKSVVAFVRYPSFVSPKGRRAKILTKGRHVVCVCNLTPVPRYDYRIGVPRNCTYLEVLNTDADVYGGSGLGNFGRVEVEDVPQHGHAQSIVLTLPPLAVLWLVPELDNDVESLDAPEVIETAAEAVEEVAAAPVDDRVAALVKAGMSAAAVAAVAAAPVRAVADEATLVSLGPSKRASS
jgi:1,4-alpha-glucan branching enzyme